MDADSEMIDEHNNLHLWRTWNIRDLWKSVCDTSVCDTSGCDTSGCDTSGCDTSGCERDTSESTVVLEVRPKIKHDIEMSDIRLIPKQEIILYGKGIAKPNKDNIYDVSVRGDIILHLTLTLI